MNNEIKAKIKEAMYEFTDGKYKISLTVNVERGEYSLYPKNNGIKFCFSDVDPAKCKRIISLMLAATEYAQSVIKGHIGSHDNESLTSIVTTRIEIDAIYPKPVALQEGSN